MVQHLPAKAINRRMAPALTLHISIPWPFSLRAALKNHKSDITAEKPVSEVTRRAQTEALLFSDSLI